MNVEYNTDDITIAECTSIKEEIKESDHLTTGNYIFVGLRKILNPR